MNRSIAARELLPGDILLSLWKSELSNAIRVFDGGDYSHAALWAGDGIVEAVIPKVKEHPLDETLAGGPLHIDVYRHRTLGKKAADVITAARTYLGRPYSYGDLTLSILVMSTSTWIPSERWQVRFLRDACELNRLAGLDRARDGELVTCTELVARSFLEADAPFRVVPTVAGRFDAGALWKGAQALVNAALERRSGLEDEGGAAAAEEEWKNLQAELRGRFTTLSGGIAPSELVPISAASALAPEDTRLAPLDIAAAAAAYRGPPVPPPARTVGEEWGANLVTPRFVAESPDLELVGRLYPASAN